MYTILWRYTVKPVAVADFERHYNEAGSWVEIFRTAPGYVKTQLYRDANDPHVFLTLDYWQSEVAFNAFDAAGNAAYQALDKICAAFTTHEERLGAFDS